MHPPLASSNPDCHKGFLLGPVDFFVFLRAIVQEDRRSMVKLLCNAVHWSKTHDIEESKHNKNLVCSGIFEILYLKRIFLKILYNIGFPSTVLMKLHYLSCISTSYTLLMLTEFSL
jgi:hypothetical protein